MKPIRGWAPRGYKLVARTLFWHWRTLTFPAALRYDRIDAPCVFDGPINGVSFAAWGEQFLAPTLAVGDIVIMENLSSHKGVADREAIRSAGAHNHVLATLLAGPEPDRAGFRQAQAVAPKGTRTIR
jgi:hypothetical protein|tara:strand:- start:4 stop:384 length:381 start_codon:yes stop_codon:yes gene_type:complete